mmetsp:Transcript_8222/g.17990  ORF Transcript_8222/g.17990 Transcript_8222/m.17990 type:complete len:142 (+) Transcript_8222:77-502(+)|eukprot:CAMPEP_0204253498 /NCGR_PEP_ID=MMETSP0468-20130131/1905_1 /ASSEMBLY_ACC=CAM_ASM_000383 /TAXON_ID=2969 /ORGANISM="Oxyrrhis marina" /LENGTH=141 /DNA_ID=CAMNT_0051227075 /DNA_START=76 /DNA_END=501 /DNA_ORIENTATION=+
MRTGVLCAIFAVAASASLKPKADNYDIDIGAGGYADFAAFSNTYLGGKNLVAKPQKDPKMKEVADILKGILTNMTKGHSLIVTDVHQVSRVVLQEPGAAALVQKLKQKDMDSWSDVQSVLSSMPAGSASRIQKVLEAALKA